MKNEVNSALKLSLLGKLSTYIVQFAILASLARLFSPEQFGTLASIQVFVLFFQMIAEMGIGPALVNEKRIGKNAKDGVFTFTLYLGLVVSVVFYYFSFYLTEYYGGGDYTKISSLISGSIFFSCISIVPLAILTKKLSFIRMAVIDVISHVISFVFVVVFLIYSDPLFSLASKPLVFTASRFILSYFSCSKFQCRRPQLSRDISFVKRILYFSVYQFSFSCVNYFARNLDSILIGKYIGFSALGVYEKGYQLMRYPVLLITGAFNSSIQPIFTKHKNNITYILLEHNKLAKKIFCLSIPISLFMSINSFDITMFLFGEQWLNISPLITILSLSLPFQIVMSTSGAFFQAINKPKLLFITGLIGSTIFVIFILFSLLFDSIEVTCLAVSLSFVINFFSIYIILFKFGFCRSSSGFYRGLINVTVNLSLPCIFYLSIMILLREYMFSFGVSFLDLLLSGVMFSSIFYLRWPYIRRVLWA